MFGHTFASLRTRRFALVTALVLSLAVAAPAAAQPVDARSPDAQDLAVQATTVDLRTPDVQDGTTPNAPVRASESTASDSVDWGYFAAGALTVLVVAGGLVLLRRRRTVHATAAH